MEHSNPLLTEKCSQKFITIGEIMLRLTPPNYGKIRASKVTYDRKHSAITEYDFGKVDLGTLPDGFNWLHLSGITPALSPSCAQLILDCLKVG